MNKQKITIEGIIGVLIFISLVVLLPSSQSKQYNQTQLKNIYNKCEQEGNTPDFFINQKEDMNINDAINNCLNQTLLNESDQLTCVFRKNNFSIWYEGVSCLNEKTKRQTIYGNCDFIKDYWKEEGYYLFVIYSKCNNGEILR